MDLTKVGSMLSEVHGLLHEAKSNVELDTTKGQHLIDRVAAAEASCRAGQLNLADLGSLVHEVGGGIKASIEKEVSIDNPEAAVIQIKGILDRLAGMTL